MRREKEHRHSMVMLGTRYRRDQWTWNLQSHIWRWQRRWFANGLTAGGMGGQRQPPKRKGDAMQNLQARSVIYALIPDLKSFTLKVIENKGCECRAVVNGVEYAFIIEPGEFPKSHKALPYYITYRIFELMDSNT